MASDGSHSALRHRARQAASGFYPSTAYPTVPWRADRAADDYGVPATPGWREIDWPAHTHRAYVHGGEVVYVDIGQVAAPPVVFVHGLAGKWQNWLENLPRVAQGRRAIALDLPGFGESPMPSGEITVSGYATLVAGLLALEFAPRVERLVLAAAAGISITNLRRRPTMTGARVAGAISAVTLAQREVVVARPRLRHLAMSFVIRHPSRIRPDLLLEIAPGSNALGFMDALEALLDYDFRDRLSDISCPTLLIWGREDMLVPVGDADEFERLIPGSRKVIFDEAGHVPMLERPERFNECLMAFLAEGAGSASGPQPVNAPSDAEPTWRAYLASTPAR